MRKEQMNQIYKAILAFAKIGLVLPVFAQDFDGYPSEVTIGDSEYSP